MPMQIFNLKTFQKPGSGLTGLTLPQPPDGAALWATGEPYDWANLRCPAPPPPKGHVALDAPGAAADSMAFRSLKTGSLSPVFGD